MAIITKKNLLKVGWYDFDHDNEELDVLDKRLKRYTENRYAFLSDDDIESAEYRYPNTRPLTIFRGLNFTSAGSYSSFINSIKNGYITLDRFTS